MKNRNQMQGTITRSQQQARETAIREDYLARLKTTQALADLRVLITEIDAKAIFADMNKLEKLLKGYDQKLAAAFTHLIGCARQMGINPAEHYADSARRISERIEGIQCIPDDGGHKLREIIGEIPGELGELAQLTNSAKHRGEGVMPTTLRLYELVTKIRETSPNWDMTAITLWRNLKAHQDDDTDRDLLATLLEKYNDDPDNNIGSRVALAEYVKGAYHNFRNGKAGKRYLRERG